MFVLTEICIINFFFFDMSPDFAINGLNDNLNRDRKKQILDDLVDVNVDYGFSLSWIVFKHIMKIFFSEKWPILNKPTLTTLCRDRDYRLQVDYKNSIYKSVKKKKLIEIFYIPSNDS